MSIKLIAGKKHNVIKRDGRVEPFSWEKLRRVLEWAVTYQTGISPERADIFINSILDSLNIRIYDKITIQKLFDEVIDVTANLTSELYPVYDKIARNLYIQKIYKEIWRIKRDQYPDYRQVLEKGIKSGLYKREILESFSPLELEELGNYIKPERDFLFTFGGLNLFMQKYSARYSKTRYLELPQHTYMRVAIQLHWKDKDRLKMIKEKYDMLSLHQIAIATPFMLNSLKETFNPTSCVLVQVDDDSESIMETARSMAIYSKNASGLGVDVSRIRAIGSQIGKEGVSSGVVPFIKIFESVISAFNQKSSRPGSCAIYYPYWHYEAPKITLLKDAGGNDDERARKLKYAVKWYKKFTDAILKDEEIYLFDPKDTPELLESYGEEFEKWYDYYSQKRGVKKRKFKARELAFLIAKVRSETGNLYWFSVDNANKFRMSRDFINQGNLCCAEVMLPTKPLQLRSSTLYQDIERGELIEEREYTGEIGICNLTSINLLAWEKLGPGEKERFTYNLLVGMDNAIEFGDYPVKAGERFNKLHRAIGIGITNYHNWLATHRVKMSEEKAKEMTHQIMEDIYYYLVKNSIRLAKERGRYHYFEGSRWSEGVFQWELYQRHFDRLEKEYGLKLNYPMNHDWEPLRAEMVQYGVRFEFLTSIPPGATSSLVLNFTEGIEPIREFKIIKEGTYNIPFLAPNLTQNRLYYEKAWEIPTFQLLQLAAIRQKFLDQSQSLNLYEKNPESAFSIIKTLIWAEKLGLKSLYYLNTLKKGDVEEEECEGCSV
ncbi:MAG: ribonucleoside-diphosphate reductase subunit alpha [Epsilonproteobacteria bacterium]|jgi:ribonucleoside-diphosphate reductase alpha chain|nr:ribonucleoside-diphosphate reductase subunit alpha [Campylobacterota bacterium]NPA89132.1 ribonucleoside-diphosphate reductase subunit alpha [Campylobacterota bacterium]